MELNIEQLSFAIRDGLAKGLVVELNTPAISGAYERISSFEPAGEGFASAKVRGMSWIEYFVPASSIFGVRMFKDDSEEEV
jgi:hypothetical protein